MYPSNLLSELRQQEIADAVRQAAQTRLIHLARPEALPIQQRWVAFWHQVKTIWWRQMIDPLKRGGAIASSGCFSAPLPGTSACVCSR